MWEKQDRKRATSYCSRTTMSATPCTCVSCLQSRDATSFLGPGCVGMKCSVNVTVEWPPTSLRGKKRSRISAWAWRKRWRGFSEREMCCVLTPQPLRGPSADRGPPLWRSLLSAYAAGGLWRWSWPPSPYRPRHLPKAAGGWFKRSQEGWPKPFPTWIMYQEVNLKTLILKMKKNLKLTLMVRSGVRSLKVVWLANTCWVSLTLPDRVSIRAAWSTSWFWYCW